MCYSQCEARADWKWRARSPKGAQAWAWHGSAATLKALIVGGSSETIQPEGVLFGLHDWTW